MIPRQTSIAKAASLPQLQALLDEMAAAMRYYMGDLALGLILVVAWMIVFSFSFH